MEESIHGISIWLLSILIALIVCSLFFLVFFLYRIVFLDSKIKALQITNTFEHNIPKDFINDEEALLQLADEYDFTQLSPEEQCSYLKGEEFTKTNPPLYENFKGKSYSETDDMIVKELGLGAFEFEQERNLLNPRFIVADKTEVNFNNNDSDYSAATAVLNRPLPVKRISPDIIYFEAKVYEYMEDSQNSHFSIGLVTKPYPSSFRLPGYNSFSIGYESTGNLKINKPFPTPLQQHNGVNSKFNAQILPPLHQSDVVGFGYVISSGTIFITHNSRKVLDVLKGCYVDLFPAVGCFSTNAKFQFNFGQLGYLWIEANVRKYGFVSTTDYKKLMGDRGLASLPEYGSVLSSDTDKILEKGEELPPRYPEDELDFFGRSSKDIVRIGSSSKARRSTSSEIDELKRTVEKPALSFDQANTNPSVTNYSDNDMNLRERLYEQASESTYIDPETLPLLVDAAKIQNRTQTSSIPEEKDVNSSLLSSSKDDSQGTSLDRQQPKHGSKKKSKKKKKRKRK